MTDDKICRNDGRCEYAIQTGAEAEGHCPSGKCVMPQPAAHLTIPGALEWDGDNGTHGADGESYAHGESAAAITTLKALGYTHNGGAHWKPPVGQAPRFDLIDDLCTMLANTEQSRRSFFDLSQDLEKRLAERDAAIKEFIRINGMSVQNSSAHNKALVALAAIAEPSKPKTCIECDQPYCHGVCVERGDQDYDRDQAQKGGADE